MKHEYSIKFSFWKITKTNYFEMIDLEESIQKVERTSIIRAETPQHATTKLRHTWSIPIKILGIKELKHYERERER